MKRLTQTLLKLLVAIVFAVSLLGCASVAQTTPVPSSGIYCLREVPSQAFRETLKSSAVTYGPYKRGRLGGDSSICDLNRFYIYSASWETRDGHSETLSLDFEQIMRKFQDETPGIHNLTRHTSQPQLVMDYQLDSVRVYYRVSQYPEGGLNEKGELVKPAVVTTFPLITRSLPSQASTAK